MPVGHLNERTVQEAAMNWLEDEIIAREGIVATVSKDEVHVRKSSKLGSGRADGLIVAQHENGFIHTSSLEAKSSRTFKEVQPVYRNRRWALHAIVVGVLASGASAIPILVFGWSLWTWVIPLILFLAAIVVFAFFTLYLPYYQSVSVIDQASRYPADEQSIAISADVWWQLDDESRQLLALDCQKLGFGLIIVTNRNKVRWCVKPKTRQVFDHDLGYLACYSRSEQLYTELLDCQTAAETEICSIVTEQVETKALNEIQDTPLSQTYS